MSGKLRMIFALAMMGIWTCAALPVELTNEIETEPEVTKTKELPTILMSAEIDEPQIATIKPIETTVEPLMLTKTIGQNKTTIAPLITANEPSAATTLLPSITTPSELINEIGNEPKIVAKAKALPINLTSAEIDGPKIATVRPIEPTIEPLLLPTTFEPIKTTIAPLITTNEPSGATTFLLPITPPLELTNEIKTEPEIVAKTKALPINLPSAENDEPQIVTIRPIESTTEPKLLPTTFESVTTTIEPLITTNFPPITTIAPLLTIKVPLTTTNEPPIVTTLLPPVTPPIELTSKIENEPEIVTKTVPTKIDEPKIATVEPFESVTTTIAPEITTKVLIKSTSVPPTKTTLLPSIAMLPTTASPITTIAPPATTIVPPITKIVSATMATKVPLTATTLLPSITTKVALATTDVPPTATTLLPPITPPSEPEMVTKIEALPIILSQTKTNETKIGTIESIEATTKPMLLPPIAPTIATPITTVVPLITTDVPPTATTLLPQITPLPEWKSKIEHEPEIVTKIKALPIILPPTETDEREAATIEPIATTNEPMLLPTTFESVKTTIAPQITTDVPPTATTLMPPITPLSELISEIESEPEMVTKTKALPIILSPTKTDERQAATKESIATTAEPMLLPTTFETVKTTNAPLITTNVPSEVTTLLPPVRSLPELTSEIETEPEILSEIKALPKISLPAETEEPKIETIERVGATTELNNMLPTTFEPVTTIVQSKTTNVPSTATTLLPPISMVPTTIIASSITTISPPKATIVPISTTKAPPTATTLLPLMTTIVPQKTTSSQVPMTPPPSTTLAPRALTTLEPITTPKITLEPITLPSTTLAPILTTTATTTTTTSAPITTIPTKSPQKKFRKKYRRRRTSTTTSTTPTPTIVETTVASPNLPPIDPEMINEIFAPGSGVPMPVHLFSS